MSTSGSADCPACRRNVLLRTDGRMYRHASVTGAVYPLCRLSGTTPKPTTPAAPPAETGA